MASIINKGESIYIAFRGDRSISDSQLRPRMYKTPKAFQNCFPGYYKGTAGVELVEYAPVVRCKFCKWYRPEDESCGFWPDEGYRSPDHFCGEGERRNNETDKL